MNDIHTGEVQEYLRTFWCWLRDGESGSMTIRNLGLVIAAIIGLPLAIWRSIVAQRQAETVQRGLFNERYQKGAEMLGSEVLSVRLGGVYALVRLAREHPGEYHSQIMTLFCAFVRNPPVVETEDTGVREDVQAVMSAICGRSETQLEIEKKEYFPLDLSGADLTGVNLFAPGLGVWNPRNSILPTANLEGASLDGTNLSRTSLTGANLKGAYVRGANLKGALMIHTNLSGSDLRGCEGLTQEQINSAVAHPPETPPNLEGVVDADTGRPLVWQGRSTAKV